MATLSGRESAKLAMPAGRGESEGIGCRGCVVVGCSASSEALPRVNFADAFRSIAPSATEGGGGGGGIGRAGTGGGASVVVRGGALVDEDRRRKEKLFPRDLCPVTLSLALRDTPLALCDADLVARLNVAFLGLDKGVDCRATSSEL